MTGFVKRRVFEREVIRRERTRRTLAMNPSFLIVQNLEGAML